MKKFLCKVIIVGLATIVTLMLVEMYVRSIPNEYSYKYNYLERHVDSIQILALGSSIGRSGIDPSYFRENAFNAANVSQDIETDCAILEKYLPRAKNLHTVIFSLLPGTFCGRMEEGIEKWRLRRYSIYMNLDVEHISLVDRFEISDPSKAFNQAVKGIRGEQTIDCFEKGMGRDSIVENESVKLSQAVSITKIHNNGYKPYNYDIIIPKVKSTIKKLSSKGVTTYLVLLPVYHTYSERIDKQMLKECDSISRDIAKETQNVFYFNMFNDSTFTTEDFRNSNHLSQSGAKKLSKKLNKIICNHAR